MKRAHLIGLERANDAMQDAAVVEQHEVLLVPVMWVYELVSTIAISPDAA